MNYFKNAALALVLLCVGAASHPIRLLPEFIIKPFKKQVPASDIQIGRIKIDEEITAEFAEKLIKKILSFSHNKLIKGVLVIVHSGGGHCDAAELVFREMKRLAKKKPVVVLAPWCCSAAYLIATAADCIVAPEASSLGSIGVVSIVEKHENYKFNKNGYSADATFEVMKAGKFKALYFCESQPLTQEERAHKQAIIDEMYKSFYNIVAVQRNLSLDNLTDWADGKTFSGTTALELGLIDHIGGYSDSLNKLFELIEMAGTPVDTYTIIE